MAWIVFYLPHAHRHEDRSALERGSGNQPRCPPVRIWTVRSGQCTCCWLGFGTTWGEAGSRGYSPTPGGWRTGLGLAALSLRSRLPVRISWCPIATTCPLWKSTHIHLARRQHPRRGTPSTAGLQAPVPSFHPIVPVQRHVSQYRPARGGAGRYTCRCRGRRATHYLRAIPTSSSVTDGHRGSITASILLSYDVTIKVEHLLKHAGRLPALRETGS